MRDFEKVFGDNIGGVLTFEFTPKSNVVSIPKAYKGCVIHPVQLIEGAQWYIGKATNRTLRLLDELTESKQSDFHTVQLSGFFPNDSEEMSLLFQEMENEYFIITCKDANGVRRLLGTEECGLKFTYKHDTGDDMPVRPGYSFQFTGAQPKKPYRYEF